MGAGSAAASFAGLAGLAGATGSANAGRPDKSKLPPKRAAHAVIARHREVRGGGPGGRDTESSLACSSFLSASASLVNSGSTSARFSNQWSAGATTSITDHVSDAMDFAMKMRPFAAGVLFASSLCACEHPAAPAATEARVLVPAGEPTASASVPTANTASPRGKRVPCTTDQSCNRDPSVSALWGHCLKDSGVCECNAFFELHPSGYCQPIAN